MLCTPKSARSRIGTRGFPPKGLLLRPETPAVGALILWKGHELYGRLARSDEHSSGIAVPGSESGYALQVRQRAEDSGFQAGEPLALQEVEAGPVDGREVESDGSTSQEETEGGREGRRVTVKAGTCLDSDRRRLLVWMWAPRASRRWSSGGRVATSR